MLLVLPPSSNPNLFRGEDRDDFLSSLKAAGLRPDVRTYNPMISACVSQGWEEAVSILDDMVADEVTPDIKSTLT